MQHIDRTTEYPLPEGHTMNEPATTTKTPLQTLQTFYAIAAATGKATQDPQYLELLDDLHLTVKSVMAGSDPVEAVTDQANEWTVTATLCGSDRAAQVFKAWGAMLKEAVT